MTIYKYIVDIAGNVDQLKKDVNGVKGVVNGLKSAMLGAFSVTAVIAASKAVFDYGTQIDTVRNKIQQLTKLEGEALNKMTGSVMATAQVYKKDYLQVLNAADALHEQMGISHQKAMDIIDKGLSTAADKNGDYLKQLEEYAGFMDEAGASAETFAEIIANQGEMGVWDDKGIDAVKESLIRIREMTPATAAALDKVGISSQQMMERLKSGQTTAWQEIQKVTNKLKELPETSQEVGTVLADVFGGAGEDASLKFLQTLGDINGDLDAIVRNTDEASRAQLELKKELEQLNTTAAETFGGMNTEVTKLKTELAGAANGAIELFKSFKESDFWQKHGEGVVKTTKALYGITNPVLVYNKLLLKGLNHISDSKEEAAEMTDYLSQIEEEMGKVEKKTEGVKEGNEDIKLLQVGQIKNLEKMRDLVADRKRLIQDMAKFLSLDMSKGVSGPTNDDFTLTQRDGTDTSGITEATSGYDALSMAIENANSQQMALMETMSLLSSTMVNDLGQGEAGFKSFANAAVDSLYRVINTLLMEAAAGILAHEGMTKGVVGLITAGAGISAMYGMYKKFAGNVQAFADGGLIYGPTLGLMGEYANASSDPEVVAPLSKLKTLMPDGGGFGKGELTVRGQNLVYVQENIERRYSNMG